MSSPIIYAARAYPVTWHQIYEIIVRHFNRLGSKHFYECCCRRDCEQNYTTQKIVLDKLVFLLYTKYVVPLWRGEGVAKVTNNLCKYVRKDKAQQLRLNRQI